ncbi:MAG: L-fuco-beta-pyranose dehydrogenase [uncultured Chloroflexi bacterium]|uniref:L-fuco-beta-pyranose dehydrogenase n=1 Tax=uncultured Chloroflexota bacterium TaxID=166587 RepID=A0A6J4H7S2_9CHLR|nr:MAG: L-fuco-beta-pyranose dehydrogenase [uncultured Chloroflexota bacterium]
MDPAERVPLGKTPLRVSRLSLGGAPFAQLPEESGEQTTHEIVQRAFALGIRAFDTAPLYGAGRSERWVGAALRQLPRDEIVVATKVGRLVRPDEQGAAKPQFDFSFDATLRSLEESLDRLGLDRVDVLHIHDPDQHYDDAIAGAYRALDRLRSEGTISAVGAGMNQAAMEARFAREGNFDAFLLAGRYTLLDNATALPELLPLCVEKRISLYIGGVYNSGILTNPVPGANFNYRPAAPEWVEKAQRLKAVCDRHDTPLMAAAIQFPAAHPAVATVLTGVRSVAELEENERMARHAVPAALWASLREEGLIAEEAPTPA